MEEHIHIDETTLLNYFTGSVSLFEKDIIKQWIEQSEENKKLARDIQSICLASEALNTIKLTDASASLKTVKRKIKQRKRAGLFIWLQRIAAILFIPLLLVSAYYWLREEPVEYMEFTTTPGMITSIDLPDGSKVWLNSGSKLIRPLKFTGKTREVSLTGEAYFQIAKDPDKRFIVSSGEDLKVEVLGTKFNIEAYEDENYIATTLEEGSVRLLYKTEDKKLNTLVMHPNQKVIYCKNTGEAKKKETFVSSEIAWKEGKIVLRDTPLEAVLKKLSHRFNVDFIIEREAIKKSSFTGTFDTQQLIQILEHFRIASGIQYRIIEPEPGEKTIQTKSKVVLY